MLGLLPNASTIAVFGETGTFPQWLRTYYRVVKYYVKIHSNAPPLVTEVLTLEHHKLEKELVFVRLLYT